jgi:ABC-type amino acid transport substrate-binding protein
VLISAITVVAVTAVLHNGRSPSPAAPPVALPPGVVASIAGTVPADIRATGHLVIGVDVPYTPNEFKNSQGQIVGFDVDLMNAIAKTLGLVPDYREMPYERIIPAVQAQLLNLGMSSMTDTKAREAMVDFVTYFNKGTLWAQRPGPPIDPNAACGRRVGVRTGSVHDRNEIPAKSNVCVAAGLAPIDKVVFDRQDDLTAALIAGKIDAMSADSPTTGFAIKLSAGALVAAGEVFDTEPYGWPVPKGSKLAESLRQALAHLMQTGEYRTIATMWGVDKGMIDAPKINGAIR